jgi:DNA-binding NarL/FixJ family response regulator
VLRSLADGNSVSDIAVRMSVSPHTVRSYVHTLGNKLGSRGQLRIAATGRTLLSAARSANHEPPLYEAEEEGA